MHALQTTPSQGSTITGSHREDLPEFNVRYRDNEHKVADLVSVVEDQSGFITITFLWALV